MASWWNACWDFLYPPQCGYCGSGMEADRSPLCGACLSRFTLAEGAVCFRCGAPVGPHLETTSGCGLCRREKFAFERVFAGGTYQDGLRAAILAAKGHRDGSLGAALVQLVWEQRRTEIEALKLNCVVPVPHHWRDRIIQTQLAATTMAQVWSRLLLVPMWRHILVKRRSTPRQASLTPAKRKLNLTKAFRVSGAANLKGLRILLVDDVLTTGTTAHQASRVLRNAGADQVYVAVIARGIGNDRLSSG
ncbi:MAG: ComF family protein [Planctomycetaceae bacterium]|nr:ComF family protein [Planctomycetaceae bacterium]